MSAVTATTTATPRPHAGRIDRLRVRHLRLLEQIAGTGSLSAASQQMQVSQPGATKMLQELESAFGCNLIDRTPRGGQLSRAGAFALDRLRIALGALDTAAACLAAAPQIPLVRVGILPLIAVSALPAVVALLDGQDALPRLTLREGTVEGLMQLLHDSEIDCAITPLRAGVGTADAAQLNITRLWETSLALAAAPTHPLARRRKLTIDMLREARWVLPPHSASTRLQFDQWFLEMGAMPPVPHVESLSFHTNLSLAATGTALTVAPLNAVRHYESRGMVRELRFEPGMSRGHMFFITRQELAGLASVVQLLNALKSLSRSQIG
ncbi:DNA-binding transcriptional LysR family regulator [Variovorax boronicumulans]|nr:DNA-binding transcriptional LysR family regulator [Variovorax boronicumulans]